MTVDHPSVDPLGEHHAIHYTKGTAMKSALALLLLAAALLVGCGGGDPESTVEQTLDAFAEGDGETVCDNIAGDGDAKVEAMLFLAVAHPGAADHVGDWPEEGDAEERCAYVADRLGPALPDLERLQDAEVDDVDVTGDTATVDIGGGRFGLEERNDEWKLTDWGPLGSQENTSEEPS